MEVAKAVVVQEAQEDREGCSGGRGQGGEEVEDAAVGPVGTGEVKKKKVSHKLWWHVQKTRGTKIMRQQSSTLSKQE
jgi:hypothetical protein